MCALQYDHIVLPALSVGLVDVRCHIEHLSVLVKAGVHANEQSLAWCEQLGERNTGCLTVSMPFPFERLDRDAGG